jgi:hypothetical protein
MKSFQLILFCFVCVAKSYGQAGRIVIEITKEKHKIYSTKVIQSVIADSSLVRSLEKNLNRFIPVKNRVRKGKYIVSVNFIVAKDGNISDIECENDPGFGMCAEVVRELKKYGKWVTGK